MEMKAYYAFMDEQLKTKRWSFTTILDPQRHFEVNFLGSHDVEQVVPLMEGHKIYICLQCNVTTCSELDFISAH